MKMMIIYDELKYYSNCTPFLFYDWISIHPDIFVFSCVNSVNISAVFFILSSQIKDVVEDFSRTK
jgi:hypothetical protein